MTINRAVRVYTRTALSENTEPPKRGAMMILQVYTSGDLMIEVWLRHLNPRKSAANQAPAQ
ncbi:hypothetical protein DQ393_30590 [Rhizobium tropici]|uniref:Uncharacterized protein n=1 Tax=Rhizobium tropici TaxID=398 RepID=A0A329Y9U0_RHITR|nr:hypothetical protein DQ393_30590 [Rhizobium tropici]